MPWVSDAAMSSTAPSSTNARLPVDKLDLRGQRPRTAHLNLDPVGTGVVLGGGVQIPLEKVLGAPGVPPGLRVTRQPEGTTSPKMSTNRPTARPTMSAPTPRSGSSARCGRSGSSPATVRAASSGETPGSEPTPVPTPTCQLRVLDAGANRAMSAALGDLEFSHGLFSLP